jgi:hypothetical protein
MLKSDRSNPVRENRKAEEKANGKAGSLKRYGGTSPVEGL